MIIKRTFLCLCVVITGCAYNQSINILEPHESLLTAPALKIIDRRTKADRETHLESDPNCLRRYGDGFIMPDKIAYIKHVIAKRIGNAPMTVTLDRFDTIEYCDRSSRRAGVAAMAGVATVVTALTFKEVEIWSYEHLPSNEGGDRFFIRLSGELDGRRFDVIRGFDYGDLPFTNFPSENDQYTTRIARAIDVAVDSMLQGDSAL